jgi:hypothetical protein
MRQVWGWSMLLLAGCSTAPVADLLDWCKPGRLCPDATAPYGGVCGPTPGGGAAGLPAPPAVPGPVFPPGGSAIAPPPSPITAPPPPGPVGQPVAPPPPAPIQGVSGDSSPSLGTPEPLASTQ